jgi:hypothetical protein
MILTEIGNAHIRNFSKLVTGLTSGNPRLVVEAINSEAAAVTLTVITIPTAMLAPQSLSAIEDRLRRL